MLVKSSIKSYNIENMTNSVIKNCIAAIANVPTVHHVLHKPCFDESEWQLTKECIESSWVSSVSPYTDNFESALKDFTGARDALAVTNGTTALLLMLLASGIEAGDEVLVPALTFVGTANAVSQIEAIPHFVDCEPKTFGIDANKLREYLGEISEIRDNCLINKKTKRKIKALLPVHVFGHPFDELGCAELAKEFHLSFLQDAAAALGSKFHDNHVGKHAEITILSFNGNKIITAGGGGALLINNNDLALKVRHLATTAKVPQKNGAAYHDQVAYNARLPGLNAALGLAQLKKLPEILKHKQQLHDVYQELFAPLADHIRIFSDAENCLSNKWTNVAILNESLKESRDDIINAAKKQNIEIRALWTLLHKLPMYQNHPRMDLTTAEELEARAIMLPSSVLI